MKNAILALLLLLISLPALAYPSYNYRNAKGEWVRKPHLYRTSRGPNIPPTATCRDGSLSFSHTARGTCSHHGGVKR